MMKHTDGKNEIVTFEEMKNQVEKQLKKDGVDVSVLKREGLTEIEYVVDKIRKYRDKKVMWIECSDIPENVEVCELVEYMAENILFCSMSCFVERYIIASSSLIERAYGSVYALGVQRELSEDEQEGKRFFAHLEVDSGNVDYTEKKYSRKNGLRDLLGEYLGINFEDHNCLIEHKMRLVYNLCILRYKNQVGKDIKVDLRPFLEDCNMENMASISAPWRQPHNSELYDELKWHLESELGPEVTSKIEKKVYGVTKLWEDTMLGVIIELLSIPYAREQCKNAFRLAIEELNKLCAESRSKQKKSKKSVLELFYTKLCVNETLGIEQNNFECLEEVQTDKIARCVTTDEAYAMLRNTWDIEKLEMEIEQCKSKWFALWDGKEISDYRFRKGEEYVVRIINMFKNNTKMEHFDLLSELLAFSAFEVVLALDRNTKLKNGYYRYKKNRTIYSNLQKEHKVDGKAEIMLIKLVMNRVALNVGFKLMDDVEMALGKLHCTVMNQSSDIDELERSSEEIIHCISTAWVELKDIHLLTYDEEYLQEQIKKLELFAATKGYVLRTEIPQNGMGLHGTCIRKMLNKIEDEISKR